MGKTNRWNCETIADLLHERTGGRRGRGFDTWSSKSIDDQARYKVHDTICNLKHSQRLGESLWILCFRNETEKGNMGN